jgi:hypothetical protein
MELGMEAKRTSQARKKLKTMKSQGLKIKNSMKQFISPLIKRQVELELRIELQVDQVEETL